MAINVRGLFKFNIGWASNILMKSNFIKSGVRFLYTEQDLGIVAYENTRFAFHNQFKMIENTFRDKMQEVCDKDGVIYTEDLKAMLHLAENNETDLTLLNKMLEKYVESKKTEKFATYVFGPVVMRLFYYLNEPKLALATFDNPLFNEYLNYHTIFRVLMCLLYKHDMFEEMRHVYDRFVEEKGVDFIGRSSVLVYAACIKENTPEALQYALSRWREECTCLRPTLRSCSLLALLSLKQNSLTTALEVLSVTDSENSTSVRSLKLLIYTNMQRYLQIVPILQHAVQLSNHGAYKPKFFADVINVIEEKASFSDQNELEPVLNLLDEIKKNDLVETKFTLEEFLLQPIAVSSNSKLEGNNTRSHRAMRQSRRYSMRQSEAGTLKHYI